VNVFLPYAAKQAVCSTGAEPGRQDASIDQRADAYDEAYAAAYRDLYIDAWPLKHGINRDVIQHLLELAHAPDDAWLDICCGQAWHFAQFPGHGLKIGIDRSRSQLAWAKRDNPDAAFVHADIRSLALRPATAALVTSFWASYCYLGDTDSITRMVAAAFRSVRPGGSLYFEILEMDSLASFNDSDFARSTGFHVVLGDAEAGHWEYRDIGGRHRMCSPPLADFLHILWAEDAKIEYFHDGAFMTHLVAQRPKERRQPSHR
jgi:ubiquinone/menaquinone biosynthesis C-methylase UbiE